MYTIGADFHKPGIYGGRVQVRANPWDVFHARRLEVVAVTGLLWIYFVVGFGYGGIFSCFFRFLYFKRTRLTASTRQPCLMYLATTGRIYWYVRSTWYGLIHLQWRLFCAIKSFGNEKDKNKTNAQGRRCSGTVEVSPHKKH